VYVAFRVTTSVTLFLAVLTLFGAARSPLVVLAVPAALLTGLAFAAPVTALAVRMENDSGFAGLQRFLVLPVFLFSGTFFPVSQLPTVLEWVAYATPLWHGVALSRGLALGTLDGGAALLHVGYLALWVAVGVALAARGFRRRLVT
jgi:lipooligosaccharide transport system permease protein